MTTGTALSTLLTRYIHNDVGLAAADKLTYLTLGQQRIIHDAPHLLATKEATLSLTDLLGRTYSLAADFYQMSAVWLQSTGVKLTPYLQAEFIDLFERQPTIPTGSPTGYTILGYDESLGSPAYRIRFDYDVDGDYTVTYWYHYMPAAVTGSATPALSAIGFDELLLWATAMIVLAPVDPQGAENAKMNYSAELGRALAYHPMQPDYTPVQRPNSYEYSGSSLTLGSHFPAE